MKRPALSDLHRKMFRQAFFTATFTEFAQIIALTIDSVIICVFLGEREIAAVGLASPFFFLVGVPSACIANGLQIVCSREMGRGRIDSVNRLFSQCVLFTLLSMSLMTLAVFLTVPQLAYCFGARGSTADLLALTEQYLYGLAFEIVPFVMMSALTTVVVLDNGSSVAMLSSALGGVANIILDVIAVRNHWGLFGIGLGSSLSAVVSMAALLIHFLRKDHVFRFVLTRIRLSEIAGILRMGLPASVHSLACMVRSIALNALASYAGGGTAVAVLAIHETIGDFVEIPAAGVYGAVGILAGIGYGENNGSDLEGTGILAHRYIFAIFSGIAAVLLLFMRPIAGVFLDRGSAGYSLLLFAIACNALGSAAGALVYSRVSYLQATGKETNARHLEETANLAALLILALVLSVPFGAYGIFAAFPFAKLISLGMVFFIYKRRTSRSIPSMREYMMLESQFFPRPEDMIAGPIDSLEQCITISEKIRALCASHDCGARVSYYAGLCAEEIATNIFLHGDRHAPEGLKAEIRATVADGTLIMRIRDNGKAFNMNALAKILSEDKTPYANLGIKIICAAATEIGYYNIYGMNTTIIRVAAGNKPKDGGEGETQTADTEDRITGNE